MEVIFDLSVSKLVIEKDGSPCFQTRMAGFVAQRRRNLHSSAITGDPHRSYCFQEERCGDFVWTCLLLLVVSDFIYF